MDPRHFRDRRARRVAFVRVRHQPRKERLFRHLYGGISRCERPSVSRRDDVQPCVHGLCRAIGSGEGVQRIVCEYRYRRDVVQRRHFHLRRDDGGREQHDGVHGRLYHHRFERVFRERRSGVRLPARRARSDDRHGEREDFRHGLHRETFGIRFSEQLYSVWRQACHSSQTTGLYSGTLCSSDGGCAERFRYNDADADYGDVRFFSIRGQVDQRAVCRSADCQQSSFRT